MPILIFWTYGAHFAVRLVAYRHCTDINVPYLAYLCNGQKVVGQFISSSSPPFSFRPSFTSLDDFIDARLGRKPTNVHLQPFDLAPNSASASSRASTAPSAPPDSPTPAARSLMSDGTAEAELASPNTPTQQTKHAHFADANERPGSVPQSTQDPLSRSARIRAFRAYQHASPEEKERMRGNWSFGLGTAGTDGDNPAARMRREWTAIHLLSADEVKSLFKDVVEGLRFLVLKLLLFWLLVV